MVILPAIDLRGGQCVRLLRGDFSTVEQVADNAVDTALGFREQGAQWLHMVDLDGALEGTPRNRRTILNTASTAGLRVQLGGGIRDMATVEEYLEHGIERIILGSAALKNPDFVRQAAGRYGQRIAVGIDARDGMVAAEGWTQTSGVHYLDFARQMEQVGVAYLIYTDISRDGTLSGPALEQLDELNKTVDCHVIASGGIKDITDIAALRDIDVWGAICGKSLYKGTLSLAQAIQVATESGEETVADEQ